MAKLAAAFFYFVIGIFSNAVFSCSMITDRVQLSLNYKDSIRGFKSNRSTSLFVCFTAMSLPIS